MTEDTDLGNLALFCDFENVALGVRDANYENFDIRLVMEKLLIKGSIIVKKAYCDWTRYKDFKARMHEAAFELIDIPHVRQSGKNSADIRLVVDALDLCYTKPHVRAFVIISGDSDFSPLVSKLRENNKIVIGVGVKNSSSDLLVSNCDEFIYYDDLVRARAGSRRARKPAGEAKPAAAEKPAGTARSSSGRGSSRRSSSAAAAAAVAAPAEPAPAPAPVAPAVAAGEEKEDDVLHLVAETAAELIEERGGRGEVWGSMVKQTLRRRKPGFHESYHGFKSFNALLEEAQRQGLLKLRADEKSGGNVITSVTRED